MVVQHLIQEDVRQVGTPTPKNAQFSFSRRVTKRYQYAGGAKRRMEQTIKR